MEIRTNNNIPRQQPVTSQPALQDNVQADKTSSTNQFEPMQSPFPANGMGPNKAPAAAERDPTVQGLEEGKAAAQEEGLQKIMEMLQQLIDMLKELLGEGEAEEAAGPEGAAAPAGAESPPSGAELDGILEQLLGLADGLEELGGAGEDLAKHIRDGVSKLSAKSGMGKSPA